MTNKKLKCPYCGSDLVVPATIGFGSHPWAAKCERCLAEGPTCRTKAEAIAAWNRRYVCDDKNGKPVYGGDEVNAGYFTGLVELTPTIRPLTDAGEDVGFDRRIIDGEIELVEADDEKAM